MFHLKKQMCKTTWTKNTITTYIVWVDRNEICFTFSGKRQYDIFTKNLLQDKPDEPVPEETFTHLLQFIASFLFNLSA